ncbi:putative exoribonuclease family protein [Aspergillus avenaceus]|uniref:Ribosomal RNA-processing protein 42 n=1 Tax=Aspergillus avenaceus TaxID=36643 RepID=A0A5N6TGL7_ASPAV|nr:putative exoribonuclease family protein [Aspergillus avenaceus]
MAAQRQASSASQTPHISPAELSYLYTSLALPGSPIRPDGRSPTQFRPLTAETDILPGTNGSARVGFADGTQAIVGVKAEVEKTVVTADALKLPQQAKDDYAGNEDGDGNQGSSTGHGSWVQMSIEIPGFRDDDALPVFLSEMMREPLVESVSNGGSGNDEMAGGLKKRLVINKRWHWRLYIDVLLLSQPQSYPLPLLSLTTHLALLSTRLPKLKSKGEEDPFFDDDWGAAEYIYPRALKSKSHLSPSHQVRPPVTLLVISVGENVIFDPSREEIAVADTVLAVSVARDSDSDTLKLLSMRTIDPPSRLTQPGVANSENVATLGSTAAAEEAAILNPSTGEEEVPGVWRPRRGGVKRSTIARMVKLVLQKGGVGEEVLEGLEGVEVG